MIEIPIVLFVILIICALPLALLLGVITLGLIAICIEAVIELFRKGDKDE